MKLILTAGFCFSCIVILHAQNVGVGTSTPRSTFHVNGTSWFQGDQTPLPATAGKGIAIGMSGYLGYIFCTDYSTNTTQNLYLQHPGSSVGIGTSAQSLSAKLHVAASGIGIYSNSSGGIALYGVSTGVQAAGVYGSASYIGTEGITSGSDVNRQAIRGENNTGVGGGYGGVFVGTTLVQGTLQKSAGSFIIDHPLDPENKFLSHSFVESPDMKNIYDGIVTTGSDGKAKVSLPDWFQALNKDFRYQLTVLGQFAQAIIVDEINDNTFTIQTDKPLVKVSWQVTGIRHDVYAEKNRIPIESSKNDNDKGKYMYPEGYDKPLSDRISVLKPIVKLEN